MLAAAILASSAMPLRAAPSDAANDPSRVDSEWILSKLVQPAPARTSFVELRGSKLLKKPLRLQGEYLRPDADTLVRKVAAPYAETTTIRAGEVEIARAGKSPRRFSLSRAPELAGLQASFGALLSGDRIALEKFYRIAAQGTRQQWTMTLVPKDAALAAKVRDVALYGRGAELRCIETRAAGNGGEIQRTLLAGAARAAQDAAKPEALQALCRGGAN